jgi:hypothetical protein
MVILHTENANGFHAPPIHSLIGFKRWWILGYPENQAPASVQIHGESARPVAMQFMGSTRERAHGFQIRSCAQIIKSLPYLPGILGTILRAESGRALHEPLLLFIKKEEIYN